MMYPKAGGGGGGGGGDEGGEEGEKIYYTIVCLLDPNQKFFERWDGNRNVKWH
jgi:hypothetical protein